MSASTIAANKVKPPSVSEAHPLLPPSGLNGTRHPAAIVPLRSLSRGPVLVTAGRCTGPEPEFEVTGVAQTDPHVRGGGVLGECSHLLLDVLGSDVDEVHMVPPAVTHRLDPRQVLPD